MGFKGPGAGIVKDDPELPFEQWFGFSCTFTEGKVQQTKIKIAHKCACYVY